MADVTIVEVLTKSDKAYRQILSMIAKGSLKPGQQVVYHDLARKLDMSSIPVIEAARRLEADGVLERRPHYYARVRKWDAKDIYEWSYVREGLDGIAARLCASRINSEQLEELRAVCEKLEALVSQRPEEQEERFPLDLRFHRMIAEFSGISALANEISRNNLLRLTMRLAYLKPFVPQVGTHWKIFEAISSGDPDLAEKAAREHVSQWRPAYKSAVSVTKKNKQQEHGE